MARASRTAPRQVELLSFSMRQRRFRGTCAGEIWAGFPDAVRPSAGLAHACHALASQRACRAAFGSRAPVQEEAEFVLWRAAKRTAEI